MNSYQTTTLLKNRAESANVLALLFATFLKSNYDQSVVNGTPTSHESLLRIEFNRLYQRLEEIPNLTSEDLEDGQTITPVAIDNAKKALDLLSNSRNLPESIDATVYGAIKFAFKNKTIIDFHNSGKIVFSHIKDGVRETYKIKLTEVNKTLSSLNVLV
jgi:hypothetical protein